MNPLSLVLAAAASLIVLRSGDEIRVQGEVRQENGRVIFRSDGVLYSLPEKDVDRVTPLQDEKPPVRARESEDTVEQETRRLRLSAEERRRLIAELEKNHSGTPPPKQQIFEEPGPRRAPRNSEPDASEEMSWRQQARAHEEEVRRASEEVRLLQRRAEDLQSKIISLMSLGFQPEQFTYDTMLLMRTRDQIPRAQSALEAAQRAQTDFREMARRKGVLPGWLR